MHYFAVRGVLVALLLKLCNKVVEKQFDLMDPRLFNLKWNNSTVDCQYAGGAVESISQTSTTTWIFAVRYLFPVLGSLLASVYLSYIRVLQIGGVILLLSTLLMSVMIFTGLICHPSSPMVPVTWLMLPLFHGLSQPCYVHVLFQWHTRRKLATVASVLYLITVVTGEVVSELISQLVYPSVLGSKATLAYVSFGVAFVMLTSYVPLNPNQEPFEMPTRARMIRYIQIFSGFILFIVPVTDMRAAVYTAELNFYNNGTQAMSSDSWLSIGRIFQLTELVATTIMLLIVVARPRQLPVSLRILSGILLELGVAGWLMIYTLIGAPRSGTVVYSVASVLDGVAESLTLVASYDLVNRIVPRSSQVLLYGVMFAVWGLGNLGSRLLVLTLEPILVPSGNKKPKFFVYHLVILVLLLACACYHKFLSLPLAHQLTPTDEEEVDRNEEMHILVESRAT